MGKKYRDRFVGCRFFIDNGSGQRNVGRQRHNATQPGGMGELVVAAPVMLGDRLLGGVSISLSWQIIAGDIRSMREGPGMRIPDEYLTNGAGLGRPDIPPEVTIWVLSGLWS